MRTRAMHPPVRRPLALCAAVALALATAGCAAPPPAAPSDASRKSVDQRKQGELEQMEKMGQRNDDNAPLK